MATRGQNERKYPQGVDQPEGGRRYWLDVPGKRGWMARYVKIVDQNEETLAFWQEIYDDQGRLVEVHEKYPVERGHQPASQGE